MSNTEKPDVATDDSGTVESRLAFADKAEALLRRILSALGYENGVKLSALDVILGLTPWLTLLTSMRRDPSGGYARVWLEAMKVAASDSESEATVCAEFADNITDEFARRFPPMLDDDHAIDELPFGDRDTQSDLQAAMVELDKQTQLVWQLESELVAIRKLNEHHASELANCRIQLASSESRVKEFDELIGRVWKASNLSQEGDLVSQLEHMRSEYDRMNVNEIFGSNPQNALVPLAKPERVEPGQRWVRAYSVIGLDHRSDLIGLSTNARLPLDVGEMLDLQDWIYLGTDKV